MFDTFYKYKYCVLQEDVNVVIVDWEKGADRKDYSQAAANTRVVGALTANVIRKMKGYAKARYRDIHLIGHSLGAHIAGYVGERISGLGRISGIYTFVIDFNFLMDVVFLNLVVYITK